MIKRKYNLNLSLAIMLGAILLTLVLGILQKRFGIFDGADAAAIEAAKTLRLFYPLTFLMYFISWLGDEMGLMIFICIVFWRGHTTEAAAFLLMLLFGGILNTRMKEFFELSRPLDSEISKLYHSDGYGYPSGHSQAGMIYSWFIYSFVQKYWYLCLLAALLMAGSRIYLGAHYFSDTVGGLICGFGVVAGAAGLYSHFRDLRSLGESIRNSFGIKVLLALAISAAYLSLAWGLDADFKYAGFLGGFFLIYPMLNIRWKSKNPLFSAIVTVVGLTILLAIRGGLKSILPEGNPADYFRYFVSGVMLAGSPFVFIKIGLLRKVDEASVPEASPEASEKASQESQ
jgi:undecaprenyl-diphosphatase